MPKVDEKTLTGEVRAKVSFAHDFGDSVDAVLSCALAVADLLTLPDDRLLLAAVEAALSSSTQLNDECSIAFTSALTIVAGYGKLARQ